MTFKIGKIYRFKAFANASIDNTDFCPILLTKGLKIRLFRINDLGNVKEYSFTPINCEDIIIKFIHKEEFEKFLEEVRD